MDNNNLLNNYVLSTLYLLCHNNSVLITIYISIDKCQIEKLDGLHSVPKVPELVHEVWALTQKECVVT